MNKKLIILSIVGVILIGIIAGRSFSYFSTANNEGVENVVESGTMALLFTDGPQIIADKLAPGEYIEKTFKVKNTGNVDTRYDVYFSEVINTFVDQSDLVYTLASNDGGYNTTSEVVVPNEASKIVNQYLISPNEEHTYTLRITFKLKETIQNVNMGRTFTAKININEFNLNSGEHFLKLIDASGVEVDKQILATNKENYTLALNNTDLTNSTNIYCNNGGIPTISGNTLNVSGITNDTVCTISNDIVDTINNKLTTTKTGIVMTNNQSNVTTMTIPSSKEVVLDLNGKQLLFSNTYLLRNEGNLNLKSSGNNKGRIQTSQSVVGVPENSVTTISNVELISTNTDNYSTLCLGGKVIINEGTYIEGPYALGCFTSNKSLAIINGGEFVSNKHQTIQLNGNNQTTTPKLIINNGLFRGPNYNIYNYNGEVIDINGGTFISDGVTLNNKNGIINITDGQFVSNNNSVIYNQTNGIININSNSTVFNGDEYVSGVFVHNNNSAATINNEGKMNINNGYYLGNSTVILPNNNLSETIISDAKIVSNNTNVSSAICVYDGSLIVNSNTYIEGQYGIGCFQSPTSNAVINDGTIIGRLADGLCMNFSDYATVTINGGMIKGSKNAIYTDKNTNININYGILEGGLNSTSCITNNGSGTINICSAKLVNNNNIYNTSTGYIYYHTNAFGSVTPTYGGSNTSNIQIKDSVCN